MLPLRPCQSCRHIWLLLPLRACHLSNENQRLNFTLCLPHQDLQAAQTDSGIYQSGHQALSIPRPPSAERCFQPSDSKSHIASDHPCPKSNGCFPRVIHKEPFPIALFMNTGFYLYSQVKKMISKVEPV